MFCTKCGNELQDGDRFCAVCGAKVRENEAPKREEVVFNPPFKQEAEKRTAAISKSIEENNAEQPQVRREPVNFDWHLDGFPSEEAKPTEDIDFNWSSVVENRRKNQSGDFISPFITADISMPEHAPVVDKIEPQERAEQIAQRQRRKAAAVQTQEDPMFKHEDFIPPLSRRTPIEDDPLFKNREAYQPEQSMFSGERETVQSSAADLEKELFGKDYKGLASFRQENVRESTAQLEKFYTYNQKKEAFQELLDKEYERLQSLEEAQTPDADSLEYTWGMRLFPGQQSSAGVNPQPSQSRVPVQPRRSRPETAPQPPMQEPPVQPMPPQSAPVPPTEPLDAYISPEELPDATIDFSAIRAAEKQKAREAEGVQQPSYIDIDEIPYEPMPAEEPVAEQQAIPPQEVQQPVTQQETEGSAFAEDAPLQQEPATAQIAGDAADAEQVAAPAQPVEAQPAAQPAEQTAAAPIQQPPKMTEADAAAEPVQVEEGPQSHQEKSKLRYSDVFPRGFVEETAAAEEPAYDQSVVNESAQDIDGPVWTEDGGYEEEEKTSIFVKILIGLLIILIVVEGGLIITKFVAPESAFSIKVNQVIDSVLNKVTGGGDISLPSFGGDDDENDNATVSGGTYITDLLNKINKPASVGEMVEAPSLKYNLSRDYAFEEIAQTTDFTDVAWKTGDDGEEITYGQGILQAVADYYDSWQLNNTNSSLVGINKLEVGEIRTGIDGYYVLCRLTYAASDNTGTVKYETAHVRLSDDRMSVNEIKEETL